MKRLFSLPTFLLISIFSAIFFVHSPHVLAGDDEWWGSGYRDPEWILERGGTIIKYKIKDEEKSNEYKVRMYQGNSMIEISYGGKAYFDDAINGLYKIMVFKGTDKAIDTEVVAKPGQEISITFDLEEDEAEVETEQVVPYSKIRLTSKSAQYITLADLGRYPVKEEPEESGEEEEQEAEESDTSEQTVDTRDTNEGALELQDEIISSFDTTFSVLEMEIPQQKKLFEDQTGFLWLVFGPHDRWMNKMEELLEEGEESLEQLDGLIEESDGEVNQELFVRQERGEEFLSSHIVFMQEKKREMSFWHRLWSIKDR